MKDCITVRNNGICVYAHWLGRRLIYVGKGSSERAFNQTSRSARWKKVIGKAESFRVQIIAWHHNDAEALEHERSLIRKLRPIANQFHKARKYPLHILKVMESFVISGPRPGGSIVLAEKTLGRKFTSRQIGKRKWRIWRVA